MATRITDLVPLPVVESTFYRLKQALKVLAVCLALYSIWLVVPAYTASNRFEEAVQSTARLAAYNDHTEGQILNEIMQQAREIGVPVKEENVHVTRGENIVRVDARYEIPVNFPGGRVFTLTFQPSTSERTLTHPAAQRKELDDGR